MTSKKHDEKTKKEESNLSAFNCCEWNFEEMKEIMKKFCGEGEEASYCCSRMQKMFETKSGNM
jgi:hypothetical protein